MPKKQKPHLSVEVTLVQLRNWKTAAKSDQRLLSSWVRATLDEKAKQKGARK